jgi:Helix-turn-helix domain
MHPSLLSGYVAEAVLAERLGVKIVTLRRWAMRRVGPARTHIGRRIYYSDAAIARWLAGREEKVEAPSRRAAG